MIYHIAPRSAWLDAQSAGHYYAPSLHSEGFIHFSYRHQIERVANAFYRKSSDLVLLCVHEDDLTAPLYIEPVADSDEQFPHLYGALNTEAVAAVVDFPKGEDGTYSLPDALPHE